MKKHFITTTDALQKLCDELKDSEWLALDTEFIREKTYYSQLCLIQIANSEHMACIDPLKIESLQPLFELLESPNIIKVLHAAGQDLEIFHNLRKSLPLPIFDTQMGAALLGYGEQIGYAALVKIMLNIELDKSNTRTDWQQRPLQEEQITYALNDVQYLGELYPTMRSQLQQKGRLAWIDDEQTQLSTAANYEIDLNNCWEKVKGANRLKRRQLIVLKHLAGWREQRAIEKNRPRRWIISDDALLNLSIQQPGDTASLQRVRQLDTNVTDTVANELISIIQTAKAIPESEWPTPNRSRKPTANEDALMDMLTAVLRIKAEENQLSPGQISSRGQLYSLLNGERNLPMLQGWRKKIAGEAVLDALEGRIKLCSKQGEAVIVLSDS